MYVSVCVCVCARECMSVRVHVRACTCTCVYVCTCAYVCVLVLQVVLISQYEADVLLPLIRNSKSVVMHCILCMCVHVFVLTPVFCSYVFLLFDLLYTLMFAGLQQKRSSCCHLFILLQQLRIIYKICVK